MPLLRAQPVRASCPLTACLCLSLLLRCQAEEKMQSEVSPRSAPCPPQGERQRPGPHPCALFPQQIRKLRRELESSQEKVATLTSQLSANVSPHRRAHRAGSRPWLPLHRASLLTHCSPPPRPTW